MDEGRLYGQSSNEGDPVADHHKADEVVALKQWNHNGATFKKYHKYFDYMYRRGGKDYRAERVWLMG